MKVKKKNEHLAGGREEGRQIDHHADAGGNLCTTSITKGASSHMGMGGVGKGCQNTSLNLSFQGQPARRQVAGALCIS